MKYFLAVISFEGVSWVKDSRQEEIQDERTMCIVHAESLEDAMVRAMLYATTTLGDHVAPHVAKEVLSSNFPTTCYPDRFQGENAIDVDNVYVDREDSFDIYYYQCPDWTVIVEITPEQEKELGRVVPNIKKWEEYWNRNRIQSQ